MTAPDGGAPGPAPRVVHPAFFALAAACFVVADTPDPRLFPYHALGLLGAVAGGVAATRFLGRVVRRPDSEARAGVLATLVVLGLTEYASFARAFGVDGPEVWQAHWPVLALWVAVVGALALAAVRAKAVSPATTRFWNGAAVAWACFAAWDAATAWRALHTEPPIALDVPAPARPAAAGRDPARPDIYFLILDKYSAGWALRENYGHDNGPFEDSLRARGFVVPRRARASYVHTFLALASMLNWTHLDSLSRVLGPGSRARASVYAMTRRNRAVALARAHGYRVTFLPSTYAAGFAMDGVNTVIRTDTVGVGGGSGFRTVALAALVRSPLAPAFAAAAYGTAAAPGRFPYPSEGAEQVARKFQLLGEIPEREGPQFVIAHLLVPHEPYVFNANCTPRDGRAALWPRTDQGANDAVVRTAYAAQVSCVNRLVLQFVDTVLARSRRRSRPPPVIVLQADHGHGRIAEDPWTGRVVPLGALPPEKVRERTSVFAAYHLPGEHPPVSDTITPVNVLPLVFNTYLGAAIAPLPDRTYWSEWNRPYEFIPLR